MIQEKIAVKTGAEDLIVSEKETATYLRLMREHTTEANLEKKSKTCYFDSTLMMNE